MLLFPCPSGCEDLLETELLALGAAPQDLRRGSGVVIHGETQFAQSAPVTSSEGLAQQAQAIALGLRVCLHSRIASRALLVLARFPFSDDQSLHAGVRAIAWEKVMDPGASLAVDCPRGEGALHHTQYAAQVCKDGIVDALRAATGRRPDVDLRDPDVRIQLLLRRGEATVSFDLAGEALHRRGYRLNGGSAPLKENLAAAVLMRAKWPERAATGALLVDPMCGAGTLLVEAAWMAVHMPPSALRRAYAADHWLGLDKANWQALKDEAKVQTQAAMATLASGAFRNRVRGFDLQPNQLSLARQALDAARLDRDVPLTQAGVAALAVEPAGGPGLVVCNPPYGERLAPGEAALMVLYGELGAALRRHPGWTGHVLVADKAQGHALGLRAEKMHALRNGPLACTLLHFASPQAEQQRRAARGLKAAPAADSRLAGAQTAAPGAAAARPDLAPALLDPGVEMLKNRLEKNLRRFGKWVRRDKVAAWRLYDADLPEFNAAIDVYDGDDGVRRLHVQEYLAPVEVAVSQAERRLRGLVQALPETTQVAPSNIFLKTRRRTQPTAQYGAHGEVASDGDKAPDSRRPLPVKAPARKAKRAGREDDFFQVSEAGLHYWVSLDAYIDTGLYLDHRSLRARLRAAAKGTEMLNLFCYTGSMSVVAAAGGAKKTTSVDLSKTYLAWAADNLEANNFYAPDHGLVHDEVEAYLAQADAHGRSFDLIFCGPPTFTNSKRARDDFDVVQDHARLIDAAMKLLRPAGQLIFTSHARKLRLDPSLLERYAVADWSAATLPDDFARRRPHQTWQFRAKPR